MKKIALLIAAVLTSAVMYGQFTIGPQIGYTASSLSLNGQDIKTNVQSNFALGVFMRIGSKVFLQPEVNYLTQGNVFTINSVREQTVNLKSIQVPLSLGFRLLNFKVVKLSVFGGATANFVVNKDVGVSGAAQATGDYLNADNFKNANYQYQVGVGLDIATFVLDVKYYGGLSDLTNGDVTLNNGSISSAKPNAFMVTLGWKIL
jgi:hypothetical protein